MGRASCEEAHDESMRTQCLVIGEEWSRGACVSADLGGHEKSITDMSVLRHVSAVRMRRPKLAVFRCRRRCIPPPGTCD